jgi:hypothetical protein
MTCLKRQLVAPSAPQPKADVLLAAFAEDSKLFDEGFGVPSALVRDC